VRLTLLVLLATRDGVGIGNLEERRRDLGEPLGLDGGDLAHVLARGEDELVINDPFGRAVEEGGGRVEENGGSGDGEEGQREFERREGRERAYPSTRVL
jgi:hypothetical protein